MNQLEPLKSQLRRIRENDWKIPDCVNAYSMAEDLLCNIGCTDSELRDHLILNLLCKIIARQDISTDQIRALLNKCIGEEHLLHGLGSIEDDSVFNRAFTLLVVEEIVSSNNKSAVQFLNDAEIREVFQAVLKCFTEENDLRGYVEEKGWAHATAHAADALASLAQASSVQHDLLLDILQAIQNKICIQTYVYVNEEDERLINTVMGILNRELVSREEIVKWILGFQKEAANETYRVRERLRVNQKNFLRGLYFRLKNRNAPEEYLRIITESLKKLSIFY